LLIRGDCLEELKNLGDNSVDCVVTDPPYGWRFMGKAWDAFDIDKLAKQGKRPGETYVGQDGKTRKTRNTTAEAAGKYNNGLDANRAFQEFSRSWAIEAFRVLKPGGHMLVFCGPRTYHRMASGVEDAGFEIRDQLQWLFGSGFPKNMDVSNAIDKAAGAEGPIVGKNPAYCARQLEHDAKWKTAMRPEYKRGPATDAAKQWQGWGTALKPANEPIVLARKPLSESTVANNVLKWGVGALNIDASRIATEEYLGGGSNGTTECPLANSFGNGIGGGKLHNGLPYVQPQGRWPANLLLDESAAEMLDEQSGPCKTGIITKPPMHDAEKIIRGKKAMITASHVDVATGASRFFYVAKTSKRERNAGLEGEINHKQGVRPNSVDDTGKFPDHDHRPSGGNNHPTVKPIKLMEYLIQLITPPNGTVLDPFMGSGTTGIACKNLGFEFIGIEMSEEYCEIAQKRINAVSR
jgi:DNA modification methylase